MYLHNHHTAAEAVTITVAGTPPQVTAVTPGDAVARTPAGPALHADLPDALPPAADLAATATASTGNAAAALDGSTDGWPGDQRHEWVTAGEKAGAWLQLTWPTPTRMTRVLLYDRPNPNDHVLAGTLTFSDGTTLNVPELPDDGQLPAVVAFGAKTCTWVKFTVTQAADATENIGLSEIGVADDTPAR